MNLSLILFLIGILGFVLNRKNVILMLISIEIMLLAITFLILISSLSFDDILGQTYAIYIIAIAGAESAIGLGILVAFYRLNSSLIFYCLSKSFSFTENPILREIFDYLSPSVSIQHANLSARALRYKIIQEYNRHKQKVIEVLRNSPGLLHISFDGWTSRNKLALYGIACFFRDEKDRLCKIMIGVPEAHRHFGSTIGGEVLDVLHTLGVGPEKIGYFTLDNAENNDTAMEVIGAELGFDGRLRRGRCIGHTLNLSAKALLFGKNADAFEQQLSGAEALSDTEYAQWRKKGPVGRLHNIVVDVRISHRLIYLFKEVQRVSGFTKSYSSHTDLAHLTGRN